MKIISWNVNGIRACIKKGFWDWLAKQNAEIVCLQESKITEKDFEKIAHEYNLTPLLSSISELDLKENIPQRKQPLYYAIATAKKPGYSGVVLLTKIKPQKVEVGLGEDKFDDEGRTIIAHYEKFSLVIGYFPNGGPELQRIPYKIDYNNFLLKKLQSLRKRQKNIIVCGDMNVAHTEIDIKNPKSNEHNSGFTKEERDWFTNFLDHKYIDTYRYLHPDARDVYTWWSYRPGVREKNIGWRIDYFVVTEESIPMVKDSFVQMEQMGSDHCPIGLCLNV